MDKNNNHDAVRNKISESWEMWKEFKKPIKFIPDKLDKLSELSKMNKILCTVLKLIILGDSLIFLMLMLSLAYWRQHLM